MFGTSKQDQAKIAALEAELARAQQSLVEAKQHHKAQDAEIKVS